MIERTRSPNLGPKGCVVAACVNASRGGLRFAEIRRSLWRKHHVVAQRGQVSPRGLTMAIDPRIL
eukprot:5143979-Lingulodinium_polyedra.AAC.1